MRGAAAVIYYSGSRVLRMTQTERCATIMKRDIVKKKKKYLVSSGGIIHWYISI